MFLAEDIHTNFLNQFKLQKIFTLELTTEPISQHQLGL